MLQQLHFNKFIKYVIVLIYQYFNFILKIVSQNKCMDTIFMYIYYLIIK